MNSSRETGQNTVSIGYMPGLDGLRTLAVLAVIAYHLNFSWAPGGLLGVCLFFVLSGYLITGILLRQWEQSGSIDLKEFWLRRARRLLPALFVMLGGVLLWAAFYAPDRLASLGQEVLAALFYTSNWNQIFHNVSYFESFGPPSPLGHLWSLAVEEQFYLFWPLLLGLGLRYLPRRRWAVGGTAVLALASALAMALIYTPGFDPSRVYYGTDTRAFALLTGAVLAFFWPGSKLSTSLSGYKRLALDGAGLAGLLIIIWMIAQTNQYQPFLYQGGLLLFSLAAAAVVAVLAHPASFLGRLFGLKPLRQLGACSYGIYLWHYPLIILTSPTVNTGGTDILRSLAQIAASIILAVLSFYLIEEPIRRGKWQSFRQGHKSPRWWKKPMLVSGKITFVSMVMVLSVFCFTVYGNMPLSQNSGSSPTQEEEREGMGIIKQTDNFQDPGVGGDKQMPELESPVTERAGNITDENSPEMNIETNPETNQENPPSDPEKKLAGQDITIIGDSVMLVIEPILQKRLPGIVIDAKTGRQMYEASDLISELQALDKLGKTVIIELGTNGSFTEEQLLQTLDSLKGVERILLVNARVPKPWQNVVNETLAKIAESYPRTGLVDWYGASSAHNEYFYSDGVHLNPTGAEAYTELLIQEVASFNKGTLKRK